MTTEPAGYREIANLLLKVDELAMALLRRPDVELETLLMRLSRDAAADADQLLFSANQMDPVPFVPDLFQWTEGKTRRAVA